MSKVLVSPETTRLLQELVMKPQMGWEVARAAAWQHYGAEGWSHLKAKRPRAEAFGAASNSYPLNLALALPPVCLEALTLSMQLLVPCWDVGLLGSPQRHF